MGPIMLATGTAGATSFNTTNERWIMNNGSHLYASTSSSSYNNKIWTDSNDGSGSGLDADTLDGLQLHTGRNNVANRVVRTDGNGYIQAGWINTTSGSRPRNTAPARIYASDDAYLRYYTLSEFKVALGLPNSTYNRSISFSNTSGYHTGVMGHSNTYNVIENLCHLGSGFIDFWSNSSNAPDNGHWVGMQAWHAVNWQGVAGRNYGWQLVNKGGTAGDLRMYAQWADSNYGWQKVWNSANDGSGSGLDADLWDGNQFSSYLNQAVLTTSSPTFTNVYVNDWFRNNAAGEGLYNQTTSSHFYSASTSYWHINSSSGSTSGALIFYSAYNSTAGNATNRKGYVYWDANGFGLLSNDGSWAYRHNNTYADIFGTIRQDGSNTVWHAGNDGSGSGLDADNLDGYTWASSGKNVRATEFYADNWFRNYNAGEGLYNQATGCHFASDATDQWTIRDAGNAIRINFKTNGTTQRASVYADNGPSIGFLNSANQWGLRYLSNDGNSPNLYFREEGNETWTGNPGNDIGKIEYHSNRFYIASGANSTEVVRFRRSGTDVGNINNSGNLTMNGNVTAYSDITLKKDIEVIPNALDKVLQISGVTYNRIDIEDEPRHSGVIAQEVEKVLPEVVQTNEDGIKSVAYGNMVGLLIEAIKEQQEQIDILKEEIEELKK